jgi:hypothetical protein
MDYNAAVIEETINKIQSLPEGTFLNHDILVEWLDVEYGNEYHHIMQKVKEELKNRGIFLQNKYAEGYEFKKHEDSIDVVEKRFYKGINTVNRSMADAKKIDITKIEPEKLTKTVEKTTKMATIAHLLTLGIRRNKELTKAK